MNSRSIGLMAGVCWVMTSYIHGAVLFQDNFSDAGSSYLAWVSSNSDFNKPEYSGGELAITNSSTAYNSYVFHELTVKPSVFTLSCKFSRSSGTVKAGVSVCFNKQTLSSYSVVLGDKSISVLKPGESSAPAINCPNLVDKDNLITISKNSSKFNVFVNNRLVISFTDNAASGDIAFMSYPGTTVIYDDVLLTDQFTDGAKPTSYSDKFDDAALTYWKKEANKGTAVVENGQLKMVTENDNSAYCYMLTDLELTNFVARVEVSHRDGNRYSMYGLRLNGLNVNDHASFVINGNRMFGAGVGMTPISMVSNTHVKGAAISVGGQTIFFTDTLEIVKRNGSLNYLFVVNKDTIDTLTGVDFPITSLGFFCQDSISLIFDNFIAAEGDSAVSPVVVDFPGKRIRNANQIITPGYSGLCDVLGRNVLSSRVDVLNQKRGTAFGLYAGRGEHIILNLK